MKRALAALLLAAACWPSSAPGRDFSTQNADALLRKLAVEIGPRPMGSPAEREALSFAAAKLLEYGCDTSYVMPMTRTNAVNTSSGVAVGILRGATGRVIVLGGHIDSAGPEIPGANDDASGCAVVLEAARVLGEGGPLQSTIVFALFGGEEQGLEGSEMFVDRFEAIDSVALMLQVDMANGLGTIILDPDTYGASAPPWLVRAAVEEFTALGYTGLGYPMHYFAGNYSSSRGSASDHAPFLRAGIPAIDFTTDVSDPIHTQQDTWENFEIAGLKRSGDLVLRLIDRFDAGTPDRTTSSYWLWLVWGVPLIVPIPLVWAFIGLSLLAGSLVLVRLRRRHAALRSTEGYAERKWTLLKLWLITLLVAAPAWMSSDLIGLIKGLRFPWFAHPGHYYVPALLAALFGLLAGLRLAGRLKISVSPYVLFKRSFIVMALLALLAAWGGVELAVGPAVCLALLSASMVIPWRLPSALPALVAPVWMFRLIFSEADSLIFRFAAPQLPGSAAVTLGVNAAWILLLSLLLLGWLPGFVALVRRWSDPASFIAAARSRRLMVLTAGLFGISCAYLLLEPSYERPWYPDVLIEEIDRPGTDGDTLRVRSSEYLDGAVLSHGGVDTMLGPGTLQYVYGGGLGDLPRRLGVARTSAHRGAPPGPDGPPDAGSVAAYDLLLSLRMPIRPYIVTLRYTSTRGADVPISTPLVSRGVAGGTEIAWYSFPDSAIDVPLSFTVAVGDTVREEIRVVYDTLASPVVFRYRQANVRRRGVVEESHLYPGPRPAAERQDAAQGGR